MIIKSLKTSRDILVPVQGTILPTYAPEAFSSVSSDRLGWALMFFVVAANRLSPMKLGRNSTLYRELELDCEDLFLDLSADDSQLIRTSACRLSSESSLEIAFSALWKQLHSDDLQVSICARVLGFYYLMERTRGEALTGWVQECQGNPAAVVLHPAVVDALAIVPLGSDGKLSQSLFLATVRAWATALEPSGITRGSG